MLRELKGTQRLPRMLAFKVRVETQGQSQEQSIDIKEGRSDGTVSSHEIGQYILKFSHPFARPPVAVATCISDGCDVEVTDTSTEYCQIRTRSSSTQEPCAGSFFLIVLGWDSAEPV